MIENILYGAFVIVVKLLSFVAIGYLCLCILKEMLNEDDS